MDRDSPENLSFDFGFAFDDENFSDRVLIIEILPDSPGSRHGPDDSLSGWVRNRKRRRDDQNIDINDAELPEQCEEQIFNCLDDGAASENQEDEFESAVGLDDAAEQDGQETTPECEASASMDFTAEQVRTIHVSSPILAAQSPYFFKLFTDGMRKSKQRHVTLQIHASEEAAFMDLLNFMYNNTLPRTTPPALLDVLMAAEKFGVASCMKYCSRLLRNLPMSCESALLYLDLPSTIMMTDTVRPLTDAAKQFLAAQFKDISKFQEEVLNLPLTGIEGILSSDDLQVASEDAVYDFTLKWARKNYPKSEERREILNARLLPHIRFSHMTSLKLKKVLMCPDIDCSLATKVVLDALFFKSEEPYRRLSTASEDSKSPHRHFLERAYRYRPVKVVAFESPRQQCVVYLDLKREECLQLYPSSRLYSQAFPLGGRGFFLSGHCNMDQQSSTHCFSLFLGMQEKGSAVSTVDYEFASRTKPSEDFVCKYKGSYTFTGGKAVGYRNLFGVAWAAFVADDSPYFVNDVLHLRAELTLRK